MPCLTIHLPGLAPVSHVLKDETTTVGRMKGNTILIEDASISLMHARITRRNGEFYLKDLNSTNGTMVNGQPVTEARLKDKDQLKFADVSAGFEAMEPAPAGAAASTVPARQEAPSPATRPNSGSLISAAQDMQSTRKGTGDFSEKPRNGKRARPRMMYAAAAVLPGVICMVAVVMLLNGKFSTRPYIVAKALGRAPARAEIQNAPAGATSRATHNASVNSAQARPALEQQTPVQQWARALKSDNVGERRRAAAALHALGEKSKAAQGDLLEALKDSDAEVQMWAALTLVKDQVYDRACVPVLIKGLGNENAVVRQVVCLSLGLMPYEDKDKEIVSAALAETAQNDEDAEVRSTAKSALEVIAPELKKELFGAAHSP